MSDEEYKDYIETREIMAEMDKNEYYFEGETNAKIELALKLIKTGKMSLEEAIIFCSPDDSSDDHEEKIKRLPTEDK